MTAGDAHADAEGELDAEGLTEPDAPGVAELVDAAGLVEPHATTSASAIHASEALRPDKADRIIAR